MRVDDFETLVRRYTIAGAWVDDQGRSYVFTADGTAVFPDRRFDYQVNIDLALVVHDIPLEKRFDSIFGEKERWGTWAFELAGDELLLYETSGDFHEVRAEQPFLSLRRAAD